MASNFTFDFSDRDIQAEVDDDDGKYSAGHEASSASKDRLEITTDGITPKSLKLETIVSEMCF